MMKTDDIYFESIRPYIDSEVQEVAAHLVQQEEVQNILRHFFGDISSEQLDKMVERSTSIYNFKETFLKPVIEAILKDSTFSLTISGKSKLVKRGEEKQLFISNHRDIILDSAFLNYLLYSSGLGFPRIAIGDNLLISEWIRVVVRLADAFIVKRSPSMREMLIESKRLSNYILSSVAGGEASVWLAQSEGRRKNSDDRTQTAVLKMLTLSAERGESEADLLSKLHITPVAITYEYDPCDYLKAKEMLAKKLDPSWKKAPLDDLINMQTGLEGQKGRVHFAIGETLYDLSSITQAAETKQEVLKLVAEEIDRQIFTLYRFYPNNYVAFDALHGGQQFAKMYSEKEKATFEKYLAQQIAKVEAAPEHHQFLREKILEMYATPLKNHLITTKQYR